MCALRLVPAAAAILAAANAGFAPVAIAQLAPYLFAGANIAVGLIALGTLRLIVQRRLLSPAAPAAAKLGA